jgi:flagellum-specific ATP synthase
VTAFFSVLLEGDDVDAPLSDAARAVLDGHVMLSRELATSGQYPAVDVVQSVSRMRDDALDPEMLAATREVISLLAARREVADLLAVGAYKPGADPRVDRALALERPIREFLQQDRAVRSSWSETRSRLLALTAAGTEANGSVPAR